MTDLDALQALAEAARDDKAAVVYSQGDARRVFSSFTTFSQKADYYAAVSPDVVLALIAERNELLAKRDVLGDAYVEMMAAAEKARPFMRADIMERISSVQTRRALEDATAALC